jgi:uncharacterized protein (TIGR02246 family)
MPTLDDLAARLDRLEADVEIRALGTTYPEACDEHDMERLMSLFTEDAVFTSEAGVMEASGKAEIEAMFVKLFKVRGPAYHWTHDHVVRPDPSDFDRATGRVYSHAETSPGATHSIAAMRYDDAYRREAGVWRFARRKIAFLYYVPVADYPGILNTTDRFAVGDTRRPADYPESLPSWQDFAATHQSE